MRELEHKLSVARGEQPAELLFKNAQLVNVFSGEIYPADVAVDDGRIVGIGDYEAREVIDLGGAYLAPRLIDGHFHVESTMVTVPEFARAVVPHGTSAMVIDPHEFTNVLGQEGIQYVLESSKGCRSIFSSCCHRAFQPRISRRAARGCMRTILRAMINDERIAGMAELMNYPGVFLGPRASWQKIRGRKGKPSMVTRRVCAARI